MADSLKNRTSETFSGWPMIIGWVAMLIFALHASTHMVAAGDTWVSLACGRHFWNHGVNTVEPFSANSHKAGPTLEEIKTWPRLAQKITDKVGLKTVQYWHPTGWIDQNWLTHVIFYWLTYKSPFADAATWSFDTLVYWKFAIYILAVICVYFTARLLSVNPAIAVIFACFAMFTGRSFLDIRPAGFSNLLVAVFMLILVLTAYRNTLYIWLIVPLAVFWCNVHGGYIYLFIMLLPFILLNFLALAAEKWFVSIGSRGLLHTVAAGVVAFVAMVIFNPFHLTNLTHTFLISISKHAEMWRQVNEWHPAFEWKNPVGTGFSFFVLVISGAGIFALWFFSRLLKPRFLTASKNILDAQKKMFGYTSVIFTYTAAILTGWTILISFSMLSLDFISFIIAGAFTVILTLSIHKNFNFIYLVIPLTLIGLGTADPAVGFQGRYIYPFILLPAFVMVCVIASGLSKNIKMNLYNIVLVALTAIAALLAMIVLFNPFKFKEPVWNIFQFLDLQRPWYPRYELASATKLDYTFLFPVIYALNIASIIVWMFFLWLQSTPQFPEITVERKMSPPEPYRMPKFNPALVAIAILTVYMAVRSRRFIPIAAIVACPVIAMLADQIIRIVAAAVSFYRKNSFNVPSLSERARSFFIVTGAVVVLFLGTMWGIKFKTIYLDLWPKSEKLESVFMRMTNSDVKPFYACEFMRDNKLAGRMFNYWTEGGFIAWGQDPDPNTGKTPLQLFIDGRAQAAYEPRVYTLWMTIMSGGPVVDSAMKRGEEVNYKKLSSWLDERLKKYGVWVVLMPADQFSSPFVGGLEANPYWVQIFIYDDQKMFIDIRTPQGKFLFDGIFNGKTIYRNDFYRNVVLADILMKNEKTAEQGFAFAVRAFKSNPCSSSIMEILKAIRFNSLRDKAYGICKEYLSDFDKNKGSYVKEPNYYYKIIAAVYSVIYLQEEAQMENNTDMTQFYKQKRAEYTDELSRLTSRLIW